MTKDNPSQEQVIDDSLVSGKARTARVSDNLTVGSGGSGDEDPPLPREKKKGNKTSVKAEEGEEEEEEAGSDEGHADDGDLDENKRIRRMLSNRESARRSRRRKQAHLGDLQLKVNQLQEENQDLVKKLQALHLNFNAMMEHNRIVKDNMAYLRAQVLSGQPLSREALVAATAAVAGVGVGVAGGVDPSSLTIDPSTGTAVMGPGPHQHRGVSGMMNNPVNVNGGLMQAGGPGPGQHQQQHFQLHQWVPSPMNGGGGGQQLQQHHAAASYGGRAVRGVAGVGVQMAPHYGQTLVNGAGVPIGTLGSVGGGGGFAMGIGSVGVGVGGNAAKQSAGATAVKGEEGGGGLGGGGGEVGVGGLLAAAGTKTTTTTTGNMGQTIVGGSTGVMINNNNDNDNNGGPSMMTLTARLSQGAVYDGVGGGGFVGNIADGVDRVVELGRSTSAPVGSIPSHNPPEQYLTNNADDDNNNHNNNGMGSKQSATMERSAALADAVSSQLHVVHYGAPSSSFMGTEHGGLSAVQYGDSADPMTIIADKEAALAAAVSAQFNGGGGGMIGGDLMQCNQQLILDARVSQDHQQHQNQHRGDFQLPGAASEATAAATAAAARGATGREASDGSCVDREEGVEGGDRGVSDGDEGSDSLREEGGVGGKKNGTTTSMTVGAGGEKDTVTGGGAAGGAGNSDNNSDRSSNGAGAGTGAAGGGESISHGQGVDTVKKMETGSIGVVDASSAGFGVLLMDSGNHLGNTPSILEHHHHDHDQHDDIISAGMIGHSHPSSVQLDLEDWAATVIDGVQEDGVVIKGGEHALGKMGRTESMNRVASMEHMAKKIATNVGGFGSHGSMKHGAAA